MLIQGNLIIKIYEANYSAVGDNYLDAYHYSSDHPYGPLGYDHDGLWDGMVLLPRQFLGKN